MKREAMTRAEEEKRLSTGYLSPWRGLWLGALGVVALCAVTPYNNFKLKNTYLYGNHLPVGALFLFFALTFLINPLLRRFARRVALAPGELLLAWAMWTAGACLAGCGLWRTLGPVVVVPAYFARAGESFLEVMRGAPDWLLLSRDPNSREVLAFYNGLYPGEAIPWAAWTGPVIGWGIGFAFVAAFSIGACALFRRQWADREKLTFPLVQLPVMLVADAESKTPLTRNPLFLATVFVVFVHHGFAALHTLYPSIPDSMLAFDAGAFQQTPPWNALGIEKMAIYFSPLGVMFLLPAEVSFSLWFTYLALHSFRVLRVMNGLDAVGGGAMSHEAALGFGAFVSWTAVLIYQARTHLGYVWARVRHPDRAAEQEEPYSYRTSFALTIMGIIGSIVWMLVARVSLVVAVPVILLQLISFFILARIMAETGMLFLLAPFMPSGPPAVAGIKFTSASAGVTMMLEQVYCDSREAPMPALANAFVLSNASTLGNLPMSSGRVSPRAFGAGVALALFLGYIAGFVAFVYVSYRYGSLNLDLWGAQYAPSDRFHVAQRLASGTTFDGNALLTAGIGGGITIALAALKARLLWWPLGPVGMMLAGTYAMDCFWFSILLAWLCKIITLRYGGVALYRKLLPVFIGLVLGESLFIGITAILSLITGVTVPPFLPT